MDKLLIGFASTKMRYLLCSVLPAALVVCAMPSYLRYLPRHLNGYGLREFATLSDFLIPFGQTKSSFEAAETVGRISR